jgi:hypothetical protein
VCVCVCYLGLSIGIVSNIYIYILYVFFYIIYIYILHVGNFRFVFSNYATLRMDVSCKGGNVNFVNFSCALKRENMKT